jgi:hypothetical protein
VTKQAAARVCSHLTCQCTCHTCNCVRTCQLKHIQHPFDILFIIVASVLTTTTHLVATAKLCGSTTSSSLPWVTTHHYPLHPHTQEHKHYAALCSCCSQPTLLLLMTTWKAYPLCGNSQALTLYRRYSCSGQPSLFAPFTRAKSAPTLQLQPSSELPQPAAPFRVSQPTTDPATGP